jgi:hypothetical protein
MNIAGIGGSRERQLVGNICLTMLIGDGFGAMPNGSALPPTGTHDYDPSSYVGPAGDGYAYFPSPGPGQEPTSNEPQIYGSALMSNFNRGAAAANWKLYLIDDWGDPITINGGISISRWM